MVNNIKIRKLVASDREFVFSLSPNLAEVAALAWHSDDVVQKMQDDYIADMVDSMLDDSTTPEVFLVAEQVVELVAEQNSESHKTKERQALGYIHVGARKDDISGEICGTVTLLAVHPTSQGSGVGKLLISAAENWALKQGYRLLHLEVFANNSKAQGFYKNLGFAPEMLHMIKEL